MKLYPFATRCILLALGVIVPAQASDEVDLVRHMATLQYMSHKANLAVEARNKPLANFYVHEIEEIIEDLETVETFDGYAIGTLVKKLLTPSFEALEDSVKAGNWEAADEDFDKLVASCNSCHKTTDHGYIHIVRSSVNPFMQSFPD